MHSEKLLEKFFTVYNFPQFCFYLQFENIMEDSRKLRAVTLSKQLTKFFWNITRVVES